MEYTYSQTITTELEEKEFFIECIKNVKANRNIMTSDEYSKRYVKLFEIGKGFYSKVYLALDMIDETVVALKFIDNNTSESTKRYSQGIQWCAINEISFSFNLKSDYCVKPNYIVTMKNHIILIFQHYLTDLGKLIDFFSEKKTKMPFNLIKKIIKDILNAFKYLHDEKKGMHRDIKADNILIDVRGANKLLYDSILLKIKGLTNNELFNVTCLPFILPDEQKTNFKDKYKEIRKSQLNEFIDIWIKNENYTQSQNYPSRINKLDCETFSPEINSGSINSSLDYNSQMAFLADFGMGADMPISGEMPPNTITKEYLAPECEHKSKNYNNMADIWAIGILLYYMLTKTFLDINKIKSCQNVGEIFCSFVCQNRKLYDEKEILSLSEKSWFVILLNGMLKIDPNERFSASKCLEFVAF